MKLYIKEHVFTFGDQFSVLDERGEEKYFVEGEVFTFGKKLHVTDRSGREVAFIRQELFTWMPQFTVEVHGREIGTVKKEFTFFIQRYTVDSLGWEVEGSFWEHEFRILKNGRVIASMEKEWMTWGDSYELTIHDPADELAALAVVITIDCVAEQDNN